MLSADSPNTPSEPALGQQTSEVESKSVSSTYDSASRSTSVQAVGRPLLAADEVRRLHANQVIVHERGKPDQQLQRLNYLKDAEYEGKWDANPDGH